jgi:hypothetical protein
MQNVTLQGGSFDNLQMTWFVVERQTPLVAMAEAIQDYQQLASAERAFPEAYVNEQFSQEEARELMIYLDRKGITVHIEEVSLPVMENMRGCQAIPAGADSGFYDLSQEKDYNLSFKVRGFYHISQAEKKIGPDESETLISGRR